ncbi:DNA recombination protein RmuC, partial [bacterium]|nr:DNA recombination protein RmuC [bacterium]
DSASKDMERAIKLQAKTIQEKYIDAPRSTDFAIMYLPTEGLFAEVIRRPGLANELQNKFRILVTGPTTLMSLLNSLQMGFKTLAIEKSTSDVWKILSAAKTEFHKYGEVWDKLSKQLSTAQNTVQEAGRRTRAVEKTLRTVESSALSSTSPELALIESLVADIDDELDDRNDDDDDTTSPTDTK